MAQLSSARAKIERAKEHLNAAKAISDALINENSNNFAARPDKQRNGWFSIVVTKMDPFPEQFLLLVGDAAHNIRSALDHIAFTFAKPGTPDKEKDVAFPLVTKRERFSERAKKCLPGVPRNVRAEIQRLQPYHGGKWSDTKLLGYMQTINNWDKHRALLVSVVGMANSTYKVSSEPPAPVIDKKFFAKRPLKTGAIIARFKMGKIDGSGATVEIEVKVATGFVLGPVFDKRMPRDLRGSPILGILKVCADNIESRIIPTFEKFL